MIYDADRRAQLTRRGTLSKILGLESPELLELQAKHVTNDIVYLRESTFIFEERKPRAS
jgi:hypothetical protein